MKFRPLTKKTTVKSSSVNKFFLSLIVFLLTAGLFGGGAESDDGDYLSAENILIVVNDASSDSIEVGEYYQSRRGVPLENLFHITTSASSTVNSDTYRDEIATPIFYYINNDCPNNILCILLTYGVPYRISGTGGSTGTQSSVDSELAAQHTSTIAGWSSNLYYNSGVRFNREDFVEGHGSSNMYLVCRLDGPTKELAMGLVDKAISADSGVRGKGYFDKDPDMSGSGYDQENQRIQNAYDLVTAEGFETVLDEGGALYGGDGSDALWYWGWYQGSNGTYSSIDVYDWNRGAIAVHTCSTGAADLRSINYWVGGVINDGISATMGTVYEPYVQGFPEADVFFEYYLSNNYTFAESAYASQPWLSWQTVMIGDPLLKYCEFVDVDNDGLPDSWEEKHFGNLDEDGDGDFDDDGLTNLQEYLWYTDPDNPDTDQDGMPDGWEVDNELNPLVNDANEDPDEDGYTNLQEYQGGSDPNEFNIAATVTTSVGSGTTVIVDELTHNAPYTTITWTPFSTHSLDVPSPQGEGYEFGFWSDGGAKSHEVSPSVEATYTAYLSGSSYSDYYFPHNAFDGDYDTFWAGGQGVTEWSLYYDLGSIKHLANFSVVWYVDSFISPTTEAYISEDGTIWSGPFTPGSSIDIFQDARYIHIKMTGVPPNSYRVPAIKEVVPIYAPDGASVTGGPGYDDTNYPPENAFDDDEDTIWGGKSGAGEWNLYYKLANPRYIGSIETEWYSTYTANVTFYRSDDGINWTQIPDPANIDTTNPLQYIRVKFTNATRGLPAVREIYIVPFWGGPSYSASYPVSNAFDEDYSTFWAGGQTSNCWTIYGDMGETEYVYNVWIEWYGFTFFPPERARLMVSNDPDWIVWNEAGDFIAGSVLDVSQAFRYFYIDMIGFPPNPYQVPAIYEVGASFIPEPGETTGGPHYDEEIYPPENTFDGDNNTIWGGRSGYDEWNLYYNLGSSQLITSLAITWYSTYTATATFYISTDGTTWTEVTNPTDINQNAQYIRVKFTNAVQGLPALREVEIL